MLANPSGTPVLLTATGNVALTGGSLLGFYVGSTSGGTVVINDYDGTTATAISGTITPAVGWHAFPATVAKGCRITIAVAAISATFFFAPG